MSKLTIYTFGFKFPDHEKLLSKRPIDKIIDVRDVINDLPGLRVRDLSGKDEVLRNAIMKDPKAQKLVESLESTVLEMLKEKKSVGLAIGCTSGRHRSITIAIELQKRISQHDITCNVHNLYFQ